ncbi:MAG: TonB-dependent receptor [Acidobacteriia bacterium]|nr:TonB-dependent receptor [Terriglobia bacterium]
MGLLSNSIATGNFNQRCVLFTVALLICTAPLAAQFDRGTVAGSITDPSGAIVPNAEVIMRNLDTGVLSRTVTNEIGLFTLSNIPIGRYEIRITAPGFKVHTRSAITLTVAQTLRMDVALETGTVQESVTVSADASLLQVDNAQVTTTIQSKVITDLPLSFAGGRAIENFAYALTPAVEGNNWTSYIAGSPAFSKEVLIDGMSATAQIQGHVGESSPTMEAVQEFTVQTSGMSAEYGRTSGAVFNFALKSGTNNFHGSAFYYLRNEALNANTWMNNWRLSQSPNDSRYIRARDRQFLGGFSAGGPVLIPKIYNGRNKTFIFGAFEHYTQERYQLNQEYTSTVPIPDFLSGNFSQLLTNELLGKDAMGRDVYAGQIFDAKTLRREGTRWVADAFPGNIMPASRISAMSAKIVDIYRKSYSPLIAGRLANNSTRTLYNTPWFHQTQMTYKGDHAISQNNKLSGSIIWTQRPRILADAGGVWDPADRNGGAFAKSRKQEVTSRAARLSNNWMITPTLINTASFAFNRYRNPSISTQAGGDWNKYLGIDGVTDAPLFPEINFGSAVNGIGITNIGYNSSGYYVGNTYIMGDSMTWVRGRHTMKFGGQFWKQQINSHSGYNALQYTFANTTTGIPGETWSNRVGFGFASFLLGDVASSTKGVPFDLYGRRDYVETYFQDDIRVNRRLTLNLGLRWEQAQPLKEKYGRWANFSPNVTNTQYNVKGALEFLKSPGDSFERNKDWKEFSPRIGVAYRIGEKHVVRGGYGIFFSPLGINYWSGVPYGFAPGYRGTNTVNATGNLARFNWDATKYPDNYVAPKLDPNTLIWGMVAIEPDSLYQAYNHQYNVSYQFEVRQDFVMEFTYMGNQGRRIHSGALNRNQPVREAYEDPKVNPTAWVSSPAEAAAAGVPYPYAGFAGNAGFALMPYPHVMAVTYGPTYFVGTNRGSSRYDSFQIQATKRMSHGIAAQASYNLSKAVGNVETAFDETWDANAGIQDIRNLAADAGTVLPYDQRHILKGYVQYQLPFGNGRRFASPARGWVNAIIGGWDMTWIFKYNTGIPLAISPNVNFPGWEGAVYADWNRSTSLDGTFDPIGFNPGVQNSPANLYFNRAAFSNPQNHKLGTGMRRYDELRGFGWSNEDIGLLKYWRPSERFSVQFRAELLNVFNRHHFANPNTGLGNLTNFGYVTGMTGEPRSVQVGLRLGW